MSRRGLTHAALASAAVALAIAPAALANTYRPNKTGDHAANGCTHSDCTVREALNKANAHSGADTIVLQGGKVYNVTLNPGNVEDDNVAADLDINDDLTIKRSGKGFAVLDAHGLNRVVDVGPAGGVNATLRNVWVRHGFSNVGAGIRSGRLGNPQPDHLTLIHGRVTGSKTIGPNGYGGGIRSEGHSTTLKLVRSTISGNTAGGQGDGGGIAAADMGTARVIASTISGNTVPDGVGGGIDLINGATKLDLTNSTIANNKATNGGGGISAFNVALILRNATIARNHGDTDGNVDPDKGGGIVMGSSADAQVRNTIIALNTSFPGDTNTPDCALFAGTTIESLGRNLFSNRPAGTFGCGGAFAFPPNIVQANPHLGKLRFNGGPTKTIALLRHSKAINRAGAGAPPRDQRGVKRHNPDIGAFERT